MSQRKTYHVTKNGDHWQVKGKKAQRANSCHDTKAEAVAKARELGRAQEKGQIIIHKANGEFQTEHTYGSDPYPPEG